MFRSHKLPKKAMLKMPLMYPKPDKNEATVQTLVVAHCVEAALTKRASVAPSSPLLYQHVGPAPGAVWRPEPAAPINEPDT